VRPRRTSVFAEIERAALRPLPAPAYEFATWKKAKVHFHYHIANGSGICVRAEFSSNNGGSSTITVDPTVPLAIEHQFKHGKKRSKCEQDLRPEWLQITDSDRNDSRVSAKPGAIQLPAASYVWAVVPVPG
jgi:hypothetical protein